MIVMATIAVKVSPLGLSQAERGGAAANSADLQPAAVRRTTARSDRAGPR